MRVPFHIDCVCSIKYEVCEYNPADGVLFDEGIVEYHVDVSPSLKLNDGDEITSEIALNLLNLHKSRYYQQLLTNSFIHSFIHLFTHSLTYSVAALITKPFA